MGIRSKEHKGGRMSCTLTFDLPTVPPTKQDLRSYIKEALESWGGELLNPDEPLYYSLGQVTIHRIAKVLTPAQHRQQLKRKRVAIPY